MMDNTTPTSVESAATKRRRLTDDETFHLLIHSFNGPADHLRDVHGVTPALSARDRQAQHFDAHGYPHNALAGPSFRHLNRRRKVSGL